MSKFEITQREIHLKSIIDKAKNELASILHKEGITGLYEYIGKTLPGCWPLTARCHLAIVDTFHPEKDLEQYIHHIATNSSILEELPDSEYWIFNITHQSKRIYVYVLVESYWDTN
jgi:hypothetical protein